MSRLKKKFKLFHTVLFTKLNQNEKLFMTWGLSQCIRGKYYLDLHEIHDFNYLLFDTTARNLLSTPEYWWCWQPYSMKNKKENSFWSKLIKSLWYQKFLVSSFTLLPLNDTIKSKHLPPAYISSKQIFFIKLSMFS